MDLNRYVNVHRSTLSGDGLFVDSNKPTGVKKDALLCSYEGIIISATDAAQINYNRTCTVKLDDTRVLDGNLKHSFGKFANDCIVQDQYNAQLAIYDNKVFLVAIAIILPGAEIFVEYGEDYWKDHVHIGLLSADHRMLLYNRGSDAFREWFERSDYFVEPQ